MSPDFKDLLSEFNARGVEFLVVGAQAVAAHGHVRATGDLDVWVRPEARNAARVLAAFGAPLHDLTVDDLSRPGTVFAGEPVPVLSVQHLIRNKRAVARPQDLADVAWLERHAK